MSQNWTQVENSNWRKRWKHTSEDIYVTVSHQSDHYEDGQEECASDGQVMRWHVRATLGEHITFGEHEYFMCEKLGCDTARNEAVKWAEEWMSAHADSTREELSN